MRFDDGEEKNADWGECACFPRRTPCFRTGVGPLSAVALSLQTLKAQTTRRSNLRVTRVAPVEDHLCRF
jgi:hypothetical protein